ncbi:MAG: hypothetical protein ABSA48_01545 [Terracidiphilus sp.]
MKEFVPAIAAIIAGIFAIVSPFITWKLKNASDERALQTALGKERRNEIKRLYTDIYVSFEQAMKQVLNKEKFTLAQEISEINAKVRLLAPEKIVEQYYVVASSLEKWSQLHNRATPRQLKVGEETVDIIQYPDPAREYKEPAKAAYDKLQGELNNLIALMRVELGNSRSL